MSTRPKPTQEHRLEAVHAILIDRRRAITNVASIAAEHGFEDLWKFNRLFRQRYASGPPRSCATLGSGACGSTRVRIALATALPTANGPERSVSRASEAAAKRKDTAHASTTRGWRH